MNDVIHLSTSADLDNYVYTKVYAGAGGTITINGTAVTMVAGASFEVLVKTVTGTADIFLIGKSKISAPNVING